MNVKKETWKLPAIEDLVTMMTCRCGHAWALHQWCSLHTPTPNPSPDPNPNSFLDLLPLVAIFTLLLLLLKKLFIARPTTNRNGQALQSISVHYRASTTDRASIQPKPQPKSTHSDLVCIHAAIHGLVCHFSGLHPGKSFKYMNYYTFTDPIRMERWVGLDFYSGQLTYKVCKLVGNSYGNFWC